MRVYERGYHLFFPKACQANSVKKMNDYSADIDGVGVTPGALLTIDCQPRLQSINTGDLRFKLEAIRHYRPDLGAIVKELERTSNGCLRPQFHPLEKRDFVSHHRAQLSVSHAESEAARI